MRLIDADALIANNQYDDWVDWNDKAVFEYIVEEQPTIEAVVVGNCDGCLYRAIGRYQRCACCRRNPDMKDGYKRREDDGMERCEKKSTEE